MTKLRHELERDKEKLAERYIMGCTHLAKQIIEMKKEHEAMQSDQLIEARKAQAAIAVEVAAAAALQQHGSSIAT